MIEFTFLNWHVKMWAGQALGLVIIIWLSYALWKAQKDKRNPIDLAEMLIWPGTKHTSLAMLMALLGGLTSCWILIDQELRHGTVDTTQFTAFLGIVVAGKAATEIVNAWRAKSDPPKPT